MTGDFFISRHDVDGVPTLSVAGDLDLTTSCALGSHLQEVAAEGHDAMAVDLTDVRFFDSSAARVLLRAWEEGRRNRRALRITGASTPVRRVLSVLLDRPIFTAPPAAS